MSKFIITAVIFTISVMSITPTALACNLASGITYDTPSTSPTLAPDSVSVPIAITAQFDHIQTSDIIDKKITDSTETEIDITGTLTLKQLPCVGNRSEPYTKPCTTYVTWVADEPMPQGDYTLSLQVRSSSGDLTTAQVRFAVRDGATLPPLEAPKIDLQLVGQLAGARQACCESTKLSEGPFQGACIPEDTLVSGVSDPPLGSMRCPSQVGEPCQLCWPTHMTVAPRLEARWTQPDGAFVYYDVSADGISPHETRSTWLSHTDAPTSTTQRYCTQITAVRVADGQRATSTACIDRDQLEDVELPTPPTDLPALCVMAPEPETPSADAPDDEGGCAAPGAAPSAPLWLLVASLLASRWRATTRGRR